jgi:enoyl-CoA hydratase
VAGGPACIQEFLPALSEAFLAIFDHPGPVLAPSTVTPSPGAA